MKVPILVSVTLKDFRRYTSNLYYYNTKMLAREKRISGWTYGGEPVLVWTDWVSASVLDSRLVFPEADPGYHKSFDIDVPVKIDFDPKTGKGVIRGKRYFEIKIEVPDTL